MAAIATAAMALSPGAAAYAADADATAPATTASANLRGAWNFENTAAGDREAANNGGSSSATAQLIGDDISIIADPAGVFGNVLHFGAGASSYMKINQYVNTGAGNASFAMWYRYDTTLDPTGDKPAVLLQQDGAGRSLLTLRPSNQYHTYVNATDVLSNNTVARGGWQHIAVSFDQRGATRSSSMSTARSTAKRTWEPRPSTPSPRCWSARTRTSAPWTRIR